MNRNKLLTVIIGVGLLLNLSGCGESEQEKNEKAKKDKSFLEMTISISKQELTKILANYYGCQKLFNIKLGAFPKGVKDVSEFFKLGNGFMHTRSGLTLSLNSNTQYQCQIYYDEYSFPKNPKKYKIAFTYADYSNNGQIHTVGNEGFAKGKMRDLFSRDNIKRIYEDSKKHTYYNYSPNSASSEGIFTPDIIEKINSDLDLVHSKYEKLTKQTPETKKQIDSDIQKLLRGDL